MQRGYGESVMTPSYACSKLLSSRISNISSSFLGLHFRRASSKNFVIDACQGYFNVAMGSSKGLHQQISSMTVRRLLRQSRMRKSCVLSPYCQQGHHEIPESMNRSLHHFMYLHSSLSKILLPFHTIFIYQFHIFLQIFFVKFMLAYIYYT